MAKQPKRDSRYPGWTTAPPQLMASGPVPTLEEMQKTMRELQDKYPETPDALVCTEATLAKIKAEIQKEAEKGDPSLVLDNGGLHHPGRIGSLDGLPVHTAPTEKAALALARKLAKEDGLKVIYVN